MVLLDVFIGLFFIYVIFSLFASIIQELISGLTSLRGRIVIQLLARLLGFEQPRERALFKEYLQKYSPTYQQLINSNIWIKRYPSYLSGNQVINIIQDLYRQESIERRLIKQELAFPPKTTENLFILVFEKVNEWRKAIIGFITLKLGFENKSEVADQNLMLFEKRLAPQNFGNRNFRNTLQILKNDTDENIVVKEVVLEKAKKDFLVYYNEYTDRAKGWFKRKIQFQLIAIGFLMAFYMNANTFQIFDKLANDPLARESTVRLAENFANNESIQNYSVEFLDSSEVDTLKKRYLTLLETGINPLHKTVDLGWDSTVVSIKKEEGIAEVVFAPVTIAFRIVKTIGWQPKVYLGFLLTGLAVSLGANFWFDLLVLLINIRNTGKRSQPLDDNKSNDKKSIQGADAYKKIVG